MPNTTNLSPTYESIQIAGNIRKFHYASVEPAELRMVAQKVLHDGTDGDFFGVCFGVRNGIENSFLAKKIGRRVLGADISPTVLDVPDGVLLNFNECPTYWQSKVSFIYSNSYDHSPDINLTMRHWLTLLRPGGKLFLQHCECHTEDFVNQLDVSGISLEKLTSLLLETGYQNITVVPVRTNKLEKAFLCVQNYAKGAAYKILRVLGFSNQTIVKYVGPILAFYHKKNLIIAQRKG